MVFVRWGILVVVIKVTFSILSNYVDYFPPNFNADFLIGREDHFIGIYQLAFYTHIISSPIAIIAGLFLIGDYLRNRFPKYHRLLGKWNVFNIVFLVAPSGLWMSQYAITGPVAGVAFAVLALLTAGCALVGWRHAVHCRFDLHQRWMTRCFLLLCSAILLRLLAGVATVAQSEANWLYPAAAWFSWLFLLGLYEVSRFIGDRYK